MTELPAGTVTFLFTDLENSTRLWDELPHAMSPALARHDEIVRDAIESNRGYVVKTTGDGFHAVFGNAKDAVNAASDAQTALEREAWSATGPLRARMGLHTCEVELRDGDYYGSAVNRAARLMSVAHGGQIVISAATAELAREAGFELRDLGEHRLAGLAHPERISQVSPPGLPHAFPPLRSVDSSPGNLPRQVTSFVGRERELQAVAELVRARPLVTLTGVGGVGKTRLALEVAADVVPDFEHGAWLCELAPVTDPVAIWDALADTFRVFPTPGRSLDDLVLGTLGPKRALLVLDNCEHLLDAAARVVDAVARHCPGMAVLATSREGLAVGGEQIVAVPSLVVPGRDDEAEAVASAESVELFLDRARSAHHGFEVTPANVDVVAELCRRLDGIPLAIELAAARAASMSPEDLVARLDQRFKLLARGRRAAIERQQTLRNTIDWSYDLLDEPERRALQRLSVFAGGAGLDAAEAVVSADDIDMLDVADLISLLVEKSLVLTDTDEEGHVRYRMFESIRQYSAERLEERGDVVAARERHAAYFVGLAHELGPDLHSSEQLAAARRIERETDNLRIALGWAVEQDDADLATRLVASVAVDSTPIGFSALDWAETAVDIPGASEQPRFAEVAGWASWSALLRGDPDAAAHFVARLDAAEVVSGRRSLHGCRARGILSIYSGDGASALRHAEEWAALARLGDDGYQIASALMLIATAQTMAPDVAAARAAGEEGVRIARQVGAPGLLAIALVAFIGTLGFDEADRVVPLLDEAIVVGTSIGDSLAVNNALGMRGAVAALRGDHLGALRDALESADEKLRFGNVNDVSASLDVAMVSLTALGDAEAATKLRGFARGRVVPGQGVEGRELLAETERTLAAQLGQDRFDALLADGEALLPREAVALLDEASRRHLD
ncbi:MAG TPA: adenylate/guanylate cyclase domain-containing protein [Acidimicrobiia bacterium]